MYKESAPERAHALTTPPLSPTPDRAAPSPPRQNQFARRCSMGAQVRVRQLIAAAPIALSNPPPFTLPRGQCRARVHE